MNENDILFTAFKEILLLFAIIAGVGALVAGRFLPAGIILSMAALLYYEEPISRFRKKHLGW
jgi:hypothetical protein